MTYNVVFKGVLPGVDEAQAKQSFAGLFGLDAEKVDRIFASSNVVIKPNVTLDLAQKFIDRLASIGVEAVSVSVEPELTLEPKLDLGADSSASASNYSAPAAQAQESSVQQSEIKPFVFTGVGSEYFKIWIVNILLSIVTLGIYSAWAKVRNQQYFYGNTSLDGASFEYTANPVKILIGRMIAIGLYIAFVISAQFSPTLSIVLLLVLFVLIPFIVVSSLRFNARSSSYRNVSFRFNGSYWQAVGAFIGWPILGMLTLTILMPFAWKKQMEFIVSNHAYGTEKFELKTEVGPFYGIYLIMIGASMVFGIALFVIAAIFGGAVALSGGATGAVMGFLLAAMIMILYVGFLIFAQSYWKVSIANIKYNNTQLQDHRFQSDWKTMAFAKIFFVNTLLTLLTLGLYIPFAKVRMAAYAAEHTQFVAAGDLDQFAAAEQEQVSTLAEGVSDIFDFDISI